MNLSLIKEMANEAFHRMVAEGELVRAKTLLKLDLPILRTVLRSNNPEVTHAVINLSDFFII